MRENLATLITDKMYKNARSSLQRDENSSKIMNIQKGVGYNFSLKQNFFLHIHPFLSKIIKVRLICLQNKSSLIELGLVIYISAARIAIDHIGSFLKSLLYWNFS